MKNVLAAVGALTVAAAVVATLYGIAMYRERPASVMFSNALRPINVGRRPTPSWRTDGSQEGAA